MNELLPVALYLLLGGLLLLVPPLPLSALAIAGYRARAGAPFLARSLACALLNAALEGLGLALLGVLVGAGIGDESAGEALVWLAGWGLLLGGLSGFLVTFALVGGACWWLSRRASGAASTREGSS